VTRAGDELLNAVAEIAREEQRELESEDIGDAAFAELSPAELAALAGSVCEPARAQRPAFGARSQTAPRRRYGVVGLGWLAAAAVLGAGLWLARLEPSVPEDVARKESAREEAVGAGERRLALPDGSTLALAEHTDVHVVALEPHEVRVQLLRGSVECDVAHDPERRFVVAAGGVEVVVKGTRFTVSSGLEAAAPEQVSVSVERGLVEVRQPPDRMLALLGAGQRWSSDGRALPAPSPAPAPPAPVESAPAPSEPARRESAPSPAAPPKPAASSARTLFERADAERLAGRSREAAAAFDELRRRYPADARAGYAAFMLGRIRLDSLHDPIGAAEAFAFAIAHPGGGFFLEDAKARRVEALDAAGPSSECRQARDRFLAEHPQALRAPSVAKLCAAR